MIEKPKRQLEKRTTMKPVMVRLPADMREKAKRLAQEQSSSEVKFNESDVYRTAISVFLNTAFTDNKGNI